IRKSDFPALREGLLKVADRRQADAGAAAKTAEASLSLADANESWWEALQTLEPFGPGFEVPTFELKNIQSVRPRSKRNSIKVWLQSGNVSWPAELPSPLVGEGVGWGDRFRNCPPPSSSPTRGEDIRLIATPQSTPKEDFPFKW